MAIPILTREPEVIYVGDTVKFRKSFADFKASDGWELNYTLSRSDGTAIDTLDFGTEITADGDGFLVTIPATTTGGWNPSDVYYAGKMGKSGEVVTVSQGFMTITNTDISLDEIKHVKKILDAIEAVIENRATEDHESYSIQGRSITKMSLSDLLSARDKYKAEYVRLKKAEDLRKGLGSRSKIMVRFNS